jgi:hypothetical protein
MAEVYQVAAGSKKISQLPLVTALSASGQPGSAQFATIPIVMGSNLPILDGTTNQITADKFRQSVILDNPNVFTATQGIEIGSGDSIQRISLIGNSILISTGSVATSTFDAFKVDALGNGGVEMYSYDKTEITPTNRFKTFLTVGTNYGDVTLTRKVFTTGDLNVGGNLDLSGNLDITQNLVVGGTITAQSYNTEFINQSIIFESGSTVFGNSNDDTHERTGSLLVSGSSSVIGNSYVSGIVQNALLGAVTQSLITQNVSQGSINSLNFVVTQSLITQNTSQAGVNTLISAVTTSLLAQTASQGLVNDLTLAVTSSLITQNISQAGVNLGISMVTASLNAYTASGATSTSNINSFTASQIAVNDLTLAVTSSLITQNTSQGLVNNLTQAVTSSLITIVGGLQSYTASLKGAAIVSSSQQITNYYKFAETASANTFYNDQTINGSLLFGGSGDEQTSAYAGGVGHMMMVDTNRTDVYTEIGTTDKPFKTLSAAITAANAANPTGTDPYTFVMMGCNINENISFNGTAFNFITLATSCRTVFNGTLTITNNPNLKQLIIRNLEFAEPVTIIGNGTTDQMNDLSFYNTSFADTLNVTCANSLALWDVYSSAAVNLTNLNYLYVGGGQITGDVTIVADSNQTLPSNGMGPGQAIVFDLICNNLIFTKGGTASYVFQPHNTRIGLNAGSYTIPSGFTVSAQASTFRGTWTNNGSLTLRNSSTDNRVIGTQPTYTGILGGNSVLANSLTGSLMATNGVISGSSQILNYNIFATTGSNTFVGNQTITGSLIVSGSDTITGIGKLTITGSFLVSGSTTQIGNNTLDGNTVLSGSVNISGSTVQIGNNTLIGNNTITGSNNLLGNNSITGNNDILGNTLLSGSLIVSASSDFDGDVNINGDFYRFGNKLFNFGQFLTTYTQSGSANTAYPMEFNVTDYSEGISITNNDSGLPTRITATNTGFYDVQFSSQLGTTTTETCEFSIWFSKTGSIIPNTNGDVSINKVAGGGNQIAAWNYSVELDAGQYVELYYSKTTANGIIEYKGTQTNPTRPATPATLLTVTQIS